MGILCFVAIYGVKVLDFTYDGWLLCTDIDLFQHYTGWGHFRNDPWQFPFGLISSLSYPFSVSVIYTDSIPMVAVFFKLLSPILPETFQYFGLYGLLSFALMGGTSMVLVHRFIESRAITVIASLFFTVSFPLVFRMYYHTALASHWLVILALIFWVYDVYDGFLYKKCIRWGAMGFLCVGIHSYFLPMVGAIMLFCVIDECITFKKLTGKLKTAVIGAISQIVSFCMAAILNLWLLGGFYGGASAVGGGIGTFESNLNTFFNPLGKGITGIRFPLYYDFQYEGYGYLGLGMLLLLVIALIGVIGLMVVNKTDIHPVMHFKEHHRQLLMGILFILFVLIASGPMFTLGYRKIFAIPLFGRIQKIADIFRSNGRFIWVSVYALMLSVTVIIDRIMRKSMKLVVFILALVIQIVDLSPEVAIRQDYFTHERTYTSTWESEPLLPIIADKSQFIIMDSSTMMMMDTAYYAFKHGMITSNFYYARSIEDVVDEKIAEYEEELIKGNSKADAVYVFLTEGFLAEKYPDLVCYEIGEHTIGVKRK